MPHPAHNRPSARGPGCDLVFCTVFPDRPVGLFGVHMPGSYVSLRGQLLAERVVLGTREN